MIICPSIAPKSMDDAISKLQSFSTDELVEIRIDGIPDLNLKRLLHEPRPRVIITNRRKDEGGKFVGTAIKQFDILTQAVHQGADFIDVEFSWGMKFIAEIKSIATQTKIICSYHNFTETPREIEAIYKSICKTNAEIIKIATTANDIADNKLIFNLHQYAKKEQRNLIALCMGEAGEISRILSGVYGGYLTFTSISPTKTTAEGQLTDEDMKTIFKADQLNNKTKIFGLVGNPVKLSKGIHFHNEQFSKKMLNAVYVNFLTSNLKSVIDAYRDDITGLSITMPFKHEIVCYLDKLDDAVAELKIINTVIKRKGKLIGYNTDLQAITAILKKRVNLKKKNIIILGTGAIAKTMAYVSIINNANVTIIGRSNDKAKLLAQELGCKWATFKEILLFEADILMNGTSAGMKGTKKIRLVPLKFFKNGMIVFDAVYNPIMTTLLHDAEESGCHIITGLELFSNQAQLQSILFVECFR